MIRLSLHLLGRAPLAGQAKTRLIPALGAEGAARAQAALLTHTARVCRAWCDAAPHRRFRLWCAPDCGHPLFAELAAPDQLRPQPEGDLGARLAAIAAVGLSEGEGVFLVGGDAVSLTPDALERAEALLRDHDAALAPARDGGYVLLGLRGRLAAALFQEMPWGSDRVAAMTRERLAALGWSWGEIPGQWDVDLPGDWERFLTGDDAP